VVTAIVVSGAGRPRCVLNLGRQDDSRGDRRDEGLGVNPVQALVVPRVIAATFVALMLYSVVQSSTSLEASSSWCTSNTSPLGLRRRE